MNCKSLINFAYSLKDKKIALRDKDLGIGWTPHNKSLIHDLAEVSDKYYFLDCELEEEDEKKFGNAFYKEYENRINYLSLITSKETAFKCRLSEVLIARTLVYSTLKEQKIRIQPIVDAEYRFIDGASRQAHTYVDYDRVIKKCYEYDINSFFPYLMHVMDFPISAEIKTLNDTSEIDLDVLGIYMLRVDNEKIDKRIYKPSKSLYYTNYDIKILEKIGVKYSLIQREDNAYICKGYADLFREYFRGLYEQKRKGNPYAKKVMNVTWGTLVKEKTFCVPIKNLKPTDNVVSLDLEKGLAQLQEKGVLYKHNTARLKPFILANARYRLGEIIKAVIDAGYNIYHTEVDSFISDIPPEHQFFKFILDDDFGNLKVKKEYKKEHAIIHIHKIVKK